MTTQLIAAPKLYIGMDSHKKSWSLHFRTDISDHKGMTIPANAEVLYGYVRKHFRDHQVSLTYEAGCCGFSAARFFLNLGWEVLVVNPADVPRKDKQNYQKTDKIDCRNLAKQLQSGTLNGIYIPGEAQDQLKSLVRQRCSVSRKLRKIKTEIKSLLLYHGHHLPEEFDSPNWNKTFLDWLWSLQWAHQTGRLCLDSKLRLFDATHKEYLEVANQARAYCRKHHKKDYYLLKTIPGIGGFLAAAILGEVGDLRRFRNEGEFASYIGLVPNMLNSGDTEKIFGVTPRSRAMVRAYIIESAWVALRFDPELQAYYRAHFGKNSKGIIVKIARKLLNRMLSVIKKEQAYRISNQQEEPVLEQ